MSRPQYDRRWIPRPRENLLLPAEPTRTPNTKIRPLTLQQPDPEPKWNWHRQQHNPEKAQPGQDLTLDSQQHNPEETQPDQARLTYLLEQNTPRHQHSGPSRNENPPATTSPRGDQTSPGPSPNSDCAASQPGGGPARPDPSHFTSRGGKLAPQTPKTIQMQAANHTGSYHLQQGLNNMLGYKMKQSKVADKDTSLLDELNVFYAWFKQNTSSVTPAPTAPDAHVPSVITADIRSVFLGINPKKATGPDGVPGSALGATVKKAQQCLFLLRQLRKSGMSIRSLTSFYRCTVWVHNGQ
eukprot:g40390.t1